MKILEFESLTTHDCLFVGAVVTVGGVITQELFVHQSNLEGKSSHNYISCQIQELSFHAKEIFNEIRNT